MFDRVVTWLDNHPWIFTLLTTAVMTFLIFSVAFSCADYNRSSQLEEVKTADFVRYTANGEMQGLDYEVIVDMDTGYQYLLFYINGDYVAVPKVDENGSFYKTIE